MASDKTNARNNNPLPLFMFSSFFSGIFAFLYPMVGPRYLWGGNGAHRN
jgi:hypothetical protein